MNSNSNVNFFYNSGTRGTRTDDNKDQIKTYLIIIGSVGAAIFVFMCLGVGVWRKRSKTNSTFRFLFITVH